MALGVLPILFAMTLAVSIGLLLTRGERLRWPVATIVLTAITLGFGAFVIYDSALLDAVRPDPAALAAGEWWRVISPLLAVEGGLLGLAFSVLLLFFAGAVAENLVGPWLMLAVYLGAGVLGQVAGYTVMQGQGYVGNSVAIVGVAALIAVAGVAAGAGARFIGAIALVPGLLLFVLWDLHGLGWAIGAFSGFLFFGVRWLRGQLRRPRRYSAGRSVAIP